MAGLVELSSDLSAHGWGIMLPKCQGKEEWGSWISALYDSGFGKLIQSRRMAFPLVLSLSVGGRKHRKEVKPSKARRSHLPVRFPLCLFRKYLEFSLEIEQPFILFSSIFTSQVILIICPSTTLFFFLIICPSTTLFFFFLPLLAAFTSTSLPYFHASLSSTSLYLISYRVSSSYPARFRLQDVASLCDTSSEIYFYISRQPVMQKNARRQSEEYSRPLERSPHVIPKPTHTCTTHSHKGTHTVAEWKTPGPHTKLTLFI